MAEIHNDPKRHADTIHDKILPACRIARSYRGEQLTDGTFSVAIELNTFLRGQAEPMATTFHPLPLCLNIRNHSPTGFAWGYNGSGPAQLALALLVDALGDVDLALRHYQEFKCAVVASWPQSWSISGEELRNLVATWRKPPPEALAE
jgi:hypothetical protein